MDTAHLQTFDAIVRQGSFNAAAQHLGIAQATISARVIHLEKEVGGRLFVRSRKVRLTQRGELFLPYARRALSVLSEGVEAVNSAEEYRLRVAVTESLGGSFLAAALGHYLDAHPQARVFAQSTTCTQVMRMLQDHQVQFGVIPWPYPGAPSALKALDVYQETVAVVCAASHPLAARRGVTMQDLKTHANPWHSTWLDSTADEALATFALDHSSALNLPAQTIRPLLLSGRGASAMPMTVIRDDLLDGRLVALKVADYQPESRTFALIHTGHEAITSEARTSFRAAVAAAAFDLDMQASINL